MKDIFDEMKEVAVAIIAHNNSFHSPQLRANLEAQKKIAHEIIAIVDGVKAIQNKASRSASNLLPEDFSSITAPSDADDAMALFRNIGQQNISIDQAQQEVMRKMKEISSLHEVLQDIFTLMSAAPLASEESMSNSSLDNDNLHLKNDDLAPSKDTLNAAVTISNVQPKKPCIDELYENETKFSGVAHTAFQVTFDKFRSDEKYSEHKDHLMAKHMASFLCSLDGANEANHLKFGKAYKDQSPGLSAMFGSSNFFSKYKDKCAYEIILDRCQKNDDSSSTSKAFDEFFSKKQDFFPGIGFAYIRVCPLELLNQEISFLSQNSIVAKFK